MRTPSHSYPAMTNYNAPSSVTAAWLTTSLSWSGTLNLKLDTRVTIDTAQLSITFSFAVKA